MTDLITVTNDSVEKHGFFCKMSARKTSAWKRKRAWLADRFSEGLQLRLLGDGERGFVEFIPAKYAWRGIENADDLVAIHCLWVVGKSKGKGHAKQLLDEVEAWARDNGYRGVTALTRKGNWLIDKKILAARGHDTVDQSGPDFDLMLKAFGDVPLPRIVGGFDQKATACGPGLTVFHSAQCPYLEDATSNAKDAAHDAGIPFRAIEVTSAKQLRQQVPNPYGVFSIVHDGREIASHYLLKKQIMPLLALS
ncbi:GNAT family N-acetyltransferase [uncultured Aliiroseovarius sp.]|uniref:GNAT family N-acetyltransferase n=1 Tax=uncultured Aliiroseovarius sp. TaxID=1658783 RepID=UPI002591D80C|nr:GNAT family N-acetyltransferase [uncultured Aliiroseovarius sp.]